MNTEHGSGKDELITLFRVLMSLSLQDKHPVMEK